MCVLVAVLPILPMASCAQSSPQSLDFTVEVSPVVHAGTPFFVVLKLPTSSALKKGRIDAQAYLIDETGEETLLAKEKLSVTRGGEFISEHVLDSLQIGFVCRMTSTLPTSRSNLVLGAVLKTLQSRARCSSKKLSTQCTCGALLFASPAIKQL